MKYFIGLMFCVTLCGLMLTAKAKTVSKEVTEIEIRSACMQTQTGDFQYVKPVMIKFGGKYSEIEDKPTDVQFKKMIWTGQINGKDMIIVFQVD